MKKFFILMEAQVDNEKYKEVVSWGVEPVSYVNSIITDHARDRGLLIRTTVIETESRLYDHFENEVEKKLKNDAVADLEAEILIGKACVNGNCDD